MSNETETDRTAARLIGKAIWNQQYRDQNPDATADERKADWQEHKRGFVAMGAKVSRYLTRKGCTITTPDS